MIARVLLAALFVDGLADRSPAAAPVHARPAASVRLPFAFVENDGQLAPNARFLARGAHAAVLVTDDGFDLRFGRAGRGEHVVRYTFEAASPGPSPGVEGLSPLDARFHFLVGEPSRWRTDVAGFGGVRWRDVAPGIDVELLAKDGRLVVELLLAPGADSAGVAVRVDGADDLEVDARGRLVVHTSSGRVTHDRLAAFAIAPDGARRTVECRFVRHDRRRFGFEAGTLAPDESLWIDPDLEVSTYLGGTPANPQQPGIGDSVTGVAVDAAGNLYAAGWTGDADFPTTPGALDPTFDGSTGPLQGDAFVASFDPDGTALRFATFLGGDKGDQALGLALGPGGDVTVCGATDGGTFPFTASFGQSLTGGLFAANLSFVSRLTADGTALVWSVRLTDCRLEAVALDGGGGTTVVGTAFGAGGATGFPVSPGAFDTTFDGGADQCVTRIDPSGAALVWSTFVGGSAGDVARDVAVDAAGRTLFCGMTQSPDYPASGLDNTFSTFLQEAVVAELDAAGATLLAATYLGADDSSSAGAVARNSVGDVVVAGHVWAFDGASVPVPFFTTPGAFDTTFDGDVDGFVTVLDPTLTVARGSTLLGGERNDLVRAIAVDQADRIVAAGSTDSLAFPVTPDAFDMTFAPHPILATPTDGFVARLSADVTALDHGTYLGGTHTDRFEDLAAGPDGVVVLGGQTLSEDLPLGPDAFDGESGGDLDGWVAKLEVCSGAFFQEFGAGCVGGAGEPPRLRGDGCPHPGAEVSLRVSHGPPGGMALILFGTTAGSTPLQPNCTLAIGGVQPLVLAVPLAPAGPLPGGWFQAAIVPPGATGPLDAFLQAVVPDAAAPFGRAATNALHVHVE